jgi:hypothetical protein
MIQELNTKKKFVEKDSITECKQYRKQRLLLETVSIIFETKIDPSQIRSELFELDGVKLKALI